MTVSRVNSNTVAKSNTHTLPKNTAFNILKC
jgi:hypothetical protein